SAVQALNQYGADHEYPNLGKVINLAPILRNLGEIFANLKRMTGKLKDYTDRELANELAKRINQFSLDPICLLYPLVVAGFMNQLENKLELTQKIQILQELTTQLEVHEENNQEAGVMSHFLKIIANLFEEVNQRLTELEKKPATE
ncbi:11664_t:CDS:2, partial [Funneliformis geosporum]